MTHSIIQKSQLEGANRLDAEYYQPEYLDNDRNLERTGFDCLQKLSAIEITKGETPLWRGDEYVERGIPFLRSENLIPGGLDLSNLVFISEKVNARMKRSKIFPNDVLVAIVGATIGQTGLAMDSYAEYNTNQAIAIVRPRNEEIASYLAIILETKFCQFQIDRLKGGGSRDNLDLHEVKIIKIPKVSLSTIDYCSSIIQKMRILEKQIESLYSQAEELLLEELGLKDFKIEDDLTYIVNSLDAESAHRADAEYFKPKYNTLISKVKVQMSKLGDLVSIKKGIEPGSEEYQDEGKLFIRVSSLSKNGIEDKDQKYLNDELYEKLKKDYEPKVGEILLTKDATPGIAYVLKGPVEGIISGGILRLKLKNDIGPEYLALCINSIIGQWQAERDAGGSVITHWKPEQIKNLFIPILPKPTQQKITDLVQKSHQASKKSKELLEEAKRKVEEMIEKGSGKT